ncbi:HNH endonuclease signature motif containing protein [Caballeronia sp. ATUFL_M1_KS5A]|uniref:HNH endonuclease n=1 Tax=Caballeronia sp. ATUFL_M1_KS5A TaxID=2921778 RepID=UPI00202914F7|nr:HNH endonuclease signature motif containing protein [Caballeronia sp. ATUFL_M1_KS5A]
MSENPQRQARTRGRAWQRIRSRQLKAHPLCAVCLAAGLVIQADEVDHVLPLFKGGTDHPSNLQSLCTLCHEAKTRDDLGLRALGCDLNGMPVAPAQQSKR